MKLLILASFWTLTFFSHSYNWSFRTIIANLKKAKGVLLIFLVNQILTKSIDFLFSVLQFGYHIFCICCLTEIEFAILFPSRLIVNYFSLFLPEAHSLSLLTHLLYPLRHPQDQLFLLKTEYLCFSTILQAHSLCPEVFLQYFWTHLKYFLFYRAAIFLYFPPHLQTHSF